MEGLVGKGAGKMVRAIVRVVGGDKESVGGAVVERRLGVVE